MSNRYPIIERCFVGTPRARIHIATAGTGRPILLLHQTPRSWDEYRDVLPLIGRHYRAIAMDTVGFGDSGALPFDENSIEAWSASGRELRTFETAEVEDMATWILSAEPTTVIDARNEDEWVHGHVPGAVHLPLKSLTREAAAQALDGTRAVIVYCWDAL